MVSDHKLGVHAWNLLAGDGLYVLRSRLVEGLGLRRRVSEVAGMSRVDDVGWMGYPTMSTKSGQGLQLTDEDLTDDTPLSVRYLTGRPVLIQCRQTLQGRLRHRHLPQPLGSA